MLIIFDLTDCCRYLPSPGSPGFYAGNSSAAVTFDQHSILLDGKRIMVFRYVDCRFTFLILTFC